MWNGNRIAVVLPTHNERDSIASVIREFEALGVVDDIVVVNNCAAKGTSERVAATSAREVIERRQGYGSAITRGLAEARDAALICVCEPDGTFDGADLLKLLPFTSECELVLGSRTVTDFIWEGANMGRFLRWGNWAVAKLIEVLYNTAYLSDVGCTMRVLTADLSERMRPFYRDKDSAFGVEMMLLAICSGARFVQVPVNYRPRVGMSCVTGDLREAFLLGLRMIWMVLRYRTQRRDLRRFLQPAACRAK